MENAPEYSLNLHKFHFFFNSGSAKYVFRQMQYPILQKFDPRFHEFDIMGFDSHYFSTDNVLFCKFNTHYVFLLCSFTYIPYSFSFFEL